MLGLKVSEGDGKKVLNSSNGCKSLLLSRSLPNSMLIEYHLCSVFGDDDTWWSDAGMLREMLAAFDSREDHFFGSFSESRGTIEHFGRISFGGGGTIISRGLVRKMQTTIDRCAEMFSDVFGGDGLIVSLTVAFPTCIRADSIPS